MDNQYKNPINSEVKRETADILERAKSFKYLGKFKEASQEIHTF